MGSIASDDPSAEADTAGTYAPSLDPITERILHALPGNQWIWMVSWAGLSVLSPLVFSTLVRISGRPFPADAFAQASWTQIGHLTSYFAAIYGSEGLLSGVEPARNGSSASSVSSSKSSASSSSKSSVVSSSSSFVSSSSSSSKSSVVSSNSSSSTSSSVISGQQCNWYGTLYPLCATTTSGWGYENGKSCIAPSTCAAQPAPYGIVGSSSSVASSSSSSSISSIKSSSSIASSLSSSSKSSSSVVSSSSSSKSSAASSSSSSSAAGSKCQYVLSNEWNTGFTATIRVTNNGSTTINGWTIGWSYSDGSVVTSSWNATVTGSNPYSATNISWNGTIQPGQSAEFGLQGNKGTSANAQIPVITGSVCN